MLTSEENLKLLKWRKRRRGKDNDVNYDKEKERRGRKGAELSRKGKERFSIK